MKVSPKDLYALRWACLAAERRSLVAQLAQHSVKRLALELERKYSLLGTDANLDISTGEIRKMKAEESAREKA